MTLPLWGQLQKAQDDPETIEAAITRRITEHNLDPAAHLAPGAALQSHKQFPTLDHPPFSVVGDKYNLFQRVYYNSLSDHATIRVIFGTGTVAGISLGALLRGGNGIANLAGVRAPGGVGVYTGQNVNYMLIADLAYAAGVVATTQSFFGLSFDEPWHGDAFLGFRATNNALFVRAHGSPHDFERQIFTTAPHNLFSFGRLGIQIDGFNNAIHFYRNGQIVHTLTLTQAWIDWLDEGFLYNFVAYVFRAVTGSTDLNVRNFFAAGII